MKKLMKHTETTVKRHLVNFLTLTFMLALLVPSASASHSPNELRVSPNNMIAQDKTNKTEPFLISPVRDKPGGSGGDKNDFWIYRMFGSNDTKDHLMAMRTNKPGGAGPFMPKSNRWLGSNETNETEPVLISPVRDKPGGSGGDSKRWPGIYQIFG